MDVEQMIDQIIVSQGEMTPGEVELLMNLMKCVQCHVGQVTPVSLFTLIKL